MLELSVMIGIIAGVLGISGFGYQVLKMIRTNETKAMTYPMMVFIGVGVAMWTAYGFTMNDAVIYGSNIVIVSLLIVTGVFKFYRESKIVQ
jgi:MtN3 and saliva related transmembrane protein